MKYCFDLDGTICSDTKGNYTDAVPYLERISCVNKLYDDGHTIIYFTARGGTTGIDWSLETKDQLKRWGAKYHQLLFNKPDADKFIDDKGENDSDFFKIEE